MRSLFSSNKSPAELRRFGWTMAVAFGAIGGYGWWANTGFGAYLLGLAAVFLAGSLFPRVLRPIERAWMALAHVLGIVMTRLLLTVAFYLLITPIGILARLTGHGLDKRPSPDDAPETYWEERSSSGWGESIQKPY